MPDTNTGEVEQLFLSLGMDITKFDKDMAVAQSEVSSAVKDLNRQMKLDRLTAEVKLNGFDNAEQSADGLKVKMEALQQQLTSQQKTVMLMNTAYMESARIKGEDNAATERLAVRLANLQAQESRTQKEIRATTQAIEQQNKAEAQGTVRKGGSIAQNVMNVIPGVSGEAPAAVQNLSMALGGLGPQAAIAGGAILGVTAIGTAMFEMAKHAAEAGEATIKMSEKMGISFDEAAGLSRRLKVAGVDAADFSQAMIRVGKSALSGIDGGNEMTNMLEALGVKLTDDSGHLKSVSEQIDLLGQAWEKAKAAGMEEEFAAGLGPKAAGALTEYLSQKKEIDALIEKAGPGVKIDPTEAREAAQQLKLMTVEMDSLKTASEKAFLPIASKFLPMIISGLKEMGKEITNIGNTMNDKSFKGFFEKMFAITTGTGPLFSSDKPKSPGNDIKDAHDVGASGNNAEAMSADQIKKIQEALKKQTEDEKLAQEEIFKATHTTVENQLHDIDVKAQKFRDDKVSETTITQFVEAEKAKIEKDAAEKREQITTEMADSVFKLTHTQYENELHDVDEKEVKYAKELGNEAEAEEWAAEEKSAIWQKHAEEVSKTNEDLFGKILKLRGDDLDDNLLKLQEEVEEYRKKGASEIEITEYTERQKAEIADSYTKSKHSSAVKAAEDAIKRGLDPQNAIAKALAKEAKDKVIEDTAVADVERQTGDFSGEQQETKKKVVADQATNTVRQEDQTTIFKGKMDDSFNKVNSQLQNSLSDMGQTGKVASVNYFSGWQEQVNKMKQQLSNITPNGSSFSGSGGSQAAQNVTKTFQFNINVDLSAVVTQEVDVPQVADQVASKILDQIQSVTGAGSDSSYATY